MRLFTWIRSLYRIPTTYVQWLSYDRGCTHAACCGVSRAEIHDTLFAMGMGSGHRRRDILVIQGLCKLAACGVPERTRGLILEGVSKRYEEWAGHPIPNHYLEKITSALVGILVKRRVSNKDLIAFVEVYPQFARALAYSMACGMYSAEAVTNWLMAPTLPKQRHAK